MALELSALGLNRNLVRDPQQNLGTKGSVYYATNPTPKDGDRGNIHVQYNDNAAGGNDSSKNVLTGTVITSCFIQTSALPSRIELAGNDIKFFDDTYTQNGRVIGDTSRLVFTHDLDSNEGFIMEKRASVYDTYDNVLSWFATPAKAGRHNYMFIGRNAYANDDERNVASIHFAVNKDTAFAYDSETVILNGIFEIEYSEDGETVTNWKPFVVGNSKAFAPSLSGFSAVMFGGGGGISGIGYANGAGDQLLVLLYATGESTVAIGSDMIPDANGAYDIGSPSFKIGTFYGSVSACPLPTVENALEILERIPEPTLVGERGHYGTDRKYFDDLTFPEEVLWTNAKGVTDLEHNNLLGFLLKTVIELHAQVKDLQSRLP